MPEIRGYAPQEYDPAQFQRDYIFLTGVLDRLPDLKSKLEDFYDSNNERSFKSQRIAGLRKFLETLTFQGKLQDHLGRLLKSQNRFVYLDSQEALNNYFKSGNEKDLQAFTRIQL